jgi:hypothetical protein
MKGVLRLKPFGLFLERPPRGDVIRWEMIFDRIAREQRKRRGF